MSRIALSLNNIAKIAKTVQNNSNFVRNLSLTNRNNAKVALIGAGGGIGQSLALLLKLNPLIVNLTLYDIKSTKGVCADLSHIDTSTHVYEADNFDLKKSFEKTDIFVICAGVPRKPNQTRDDLFKVNAGIVADILKEIINLKYMPTIAIITNPVNSIVPMAFTLLSKYFKDEEVAAKLFGVTTLDCVRASTFYANHLNKDPREVIVPVVGGHSEKTICPLFSLSNFPCNDSKVCQDLTTLVRKAGTAVVEAKGGAGSATLSMAYAGNRFVNSLLEAYHGKGTTECAFVYSKIHSGFNFFAEIVRLDGRGIHSFLSHERASISELETIDTIVSDLKEEIKKGVDFAETLLLENKGKVTKLNEI